MNVLRFILYIFLAINNIICKLLIYVCALATFFFIENIIYTIAQ